MSKEISGISQIKLDLPLFIKGKVREVYHLDSARLLMVASDRVSAFDYVLPTLIPDKGKILTQISVYWFRLTEHIIPNHLLATDVSEFPPQLKPYHTQIDGRALVVKKAERLPVECVVRGYLAGSAWKEYQQQGEVCGIKLPAGLAKADRLPQPLFTPATKESEGKHDENINYNRLEKLVGKTVAFRLREVSLRIYQFAAEYAFRRGLILADTKFEFGLEKRDGREDLMLIDELLTPDSSRFWDREQYRPGSVPENFDKQYIRDYLESIKWNKQPPVPELPDEVVAKTQEKYRQTYRRILGKEFR